MSDGSIILDTKIDNSGLKKGTDEIKNTVNSRLGTMSNGFSKTGAKLTKTITKPALIAGHALAGMVIGKGMQRLGAIDNAKAKLSALGHSAEGVEEIMDNATASVKGTAFGLDEAANTAAAAVAAGIQPGKELTRYLKLCGDAAAVAGVDMSEMGSIFNKVAANGKVGTDELNQLADRGIPIWQLLAKETGMSMDELRKAVSDGQIDINTFQGAIEKMGKGAGEVAKEMGSSTLSGALKNLWASVGRVGANFLSAGDDGEGVFDKLRDLVVKLTDKMGTLEEKAKVWGAVLGEVFGAVIDYFKTGNTDMDGMSSKAQEVFNAIHPLLAIIKTVGTWFMGLSTKGKLAFAGLVIGAGPLLTTMSKLFKVGKTIHTFAGGVKAAMTGVETSVTGAKLAATGLKGAMTGLKTAFSVMTGPVGLVVLAIAAAVAIGVLLYKNWDKIKVWLIAIWNAIKTAASTVFNAIKQVIVGVWNGIKTAAMAVWNGIKTALTAIWNGIKMVAMAVFNGIKAYFTFILNIYKTIFRGAFNIIKNYIVTPIKNAVTAVKNWFTNLKEGISTRIQSIKNSVSEKFRAIKDAMLAPIRNARDAIKAIIDKIKGFFSFDFQLPHIKLPHFSVHPKGWRFGDLLKGDIPSLGIDWYAKGAIFRRPTLLAGGKRIAGVGEAGPEAVTPISVLQDYVKSAVVSVIHGLVSAVETMASAVISFGGMIGQPIQQLTSSIDVERFGQMNPVYMAGANGETRTNIQAFDYNLMRDVMVDALSNVVVESELNLDGNTVAKSSTPFINKRMYRQKVLDERRA